RDASSSCPPLERNELGTLLTALFGSTAERSRAENEKISPRQVKSCSREARGEPRGEGARLREPGRPPDHRTAPRPCATRPRCRFARRESHMGRGEWLPTTSRRCDH